MAPCAQCGLGASCTSHSCHWCTYIHHKCWLFLFLFMFLFLTQRFQSFFFSNNQQKHLSTIHESASYELPPREPGRVLNGLLPLCLVAFLDAVADRNTFSQVLLNPRVSIHHCNMMASYCGIIQNSVSWKLSILFCLSHKINVLKDQTLNLLDENYKVSKLCLSYLTSFKALLEALNISIN